MNERERGHEVFPSSDRIITPDQYAYLEYLLSKRDEHIATLETENEWLKYDQLSGVLVAKVIRVELERKVVRASETNEPFALIFGDVDNMKAVNSLYGYVGGDAIIAAVGRACRRDDLVGRAGGDELWWIADLKPREDYFVARTPLLKPTPEHQAILMARSFERRANEEIRKINLGPQIGFSVGIAVHQKGDKAEDLIRRANQDMTEKKENNKALRKS